MPRTTKVLPTDHDAVSESIALLVTAVLLHVFSWCCLLFVLIFLAPRAKEVFDEFGINLPTAVVGVIALSDWFTGFWYLLVPLVLMAAVSVTAIVFAASRSRSVRLSWTILGAFIPLLLAASGFAALRITMAKLMRDIT
jgi:type II secretory pathway component PulF